MTLPGEQLKCDARWHWRDFAAAADLFLGTAAVILWQNAHLVVLWDLSYVLDTAARIAAGQTPYRDFPLAHAPLTFLIQAAVIRLAGRVFFHHVVYCALVGGLGTVLAWRILWHRLAGRMRGAWVVSLLLAVPLTVLGVYCILPHPFYDCDCVVSILFAVLLLQRLEREPENGTKRHRAAQLVCPFAAGAAAVGPLFFKQNIGLAFLAAVVAAVLLLLVGRLFQNRPSAEPGAGSPALLAVLAGAAMSLSVAGLLLHFTAGLGNYIHWTIGFAAQRRLPGLGLMIDVYREPALMWMLPCAAAGLILWRSRLVKAWWAGLVALGLLAAPFLWTLGSLLVYEDADERGDSLLALWPLLLILAAVLTLFNLRRGLTLRALLPAILLVTVNGTLMSQQLWGSTYAIWPPLVLLIAEMIVLLNLDDSSGVAREATRKAAERDVRRAETDEMHSSGAKALVNGEAFTARLKSCPATSRIHSAARYGQVVAWVVAVTLLVCGGFYTASEERLSYASIPDGPVIHATLPQLAGMATPGPYLPNFEELLGFSAANIPASDGLILIPGEDPFYFASGRVPRFPVLLFDPATDPYSPAELVQEARGRGIRWLIVKRELQIKEDPTPEREEVMKSLLRDFTLDRRLQGYDVYRRPY